MCQHKWDEALSETTEGGIWKIYKRKIVPCALCESLKVTFRLKERDGNITEKVVVVESGWDLDR
jgi:hypothetical protein